MPTLEILAVDHDRPEIKFYDAAISACRGYEKSYPFTCPLCGGEAHVYRTCVNGHHSAKCESCGMDFVE